MIENRNSAFLEDLSENLRLYFETCDLAVLQSIINARKDFNTAQKDAMLWVIDHPHSTFTKSVASTSKE
jgi:hypothetical protein